MNVLNDRFLYRTIRRRWLLAAAAAGGIAGGTACASGATDAAPVAASRGSPEAGARLRLLGSSTLRHRLQFKGTTVGGLSGLDYDRSSDLWYAISDDLPARFYILRLALSAGGIGEPEPVDVVTMKQPDGRPYPRRGPGRLRVDPEAIRYRGETRTLLWTSEGDRWRGIAPALCEMTLDGRHLRSFPLPAHFATDAAAQEERQQSGPRHNGAFEGLALTSDGRGAWVAMEHPLLQDEPRPGSDDAAAACRFTLFDLKSGQPARQIAYRPERTPRLPLPGFAFVDHGVSEILMLDAHRMLVLERGLSLSLSGLLTLRLFMIDVREAGDTLGLFSLRDARVEAARKTLVADFGTLGLDRLDNTEGMSWGPPLAAQDGGPAARTLVFVSDDNFNPLQITQFAAFTFTP